MPAITQYRNDILSSHTASLSKLFTGEEDAEDKGGKKYFDDEQDEILVANADSLPTGSSEGFAVVDYFEFTGENYQHVLDLLKPKDVQRLSLTPQNVTLPIALMMMDSVKFPTVSRARKFCRHGRILVHRGRLGNGNVFVQDKIIMGKVGDRVYLGDIIGRQVAVGRGYFAARQEKRAPPFELPVVFEDDHFAVVNKPPGIVVYSPKNAGQGLMTVKAALPHVLEPSKAGTLSALKRPKAVHRLDKPTTGLLVVGKTLSAMDNLSKQFQERVVKKTYTAVINGIPEEDPEAYISSEQAFNLGMDVDPDSEHKWQLIDSPLKDNKNEMRHAVTAWRVIRYAKSLKARDGVLTLVELKPKTGDTWLGWRVEL